MKEVELEAKADFYPIELSGGQAQRVSIARAFLYPSELLLMDEPFSSLDTALKIRLIDVFFRLWKKENKTVIFVTHDVEEALAMADKIVVLSRKGDEAVNIVDQIVIDENVDDRDLYGANLNDMRKRIMSALTEC